MSNQQQKPVFKKAIKKKVKLRIAASGGAGSGKTESLLRMATGFVSNLGPRTDKFQPDPFDESKEIPLSRIAYIDSENGSASLYAHKFDFDVIDIEPPFTSDKFIYAIRLAEQMGYDWAIIDSLSHPWAGEGGLLDKKDRMDQSNQKSKFNNWKPIGDEQNVFMNTMLFSDIHIGATLRAKTAYVLEKNAQGKEQPKKVGMAPIQRDGVEFEFTVLLEMENGGYATASKDRTSIFMDKGQWRVDYDDGVKLREWLEQGAPLTQAEKENTARKQAALTQPPPQGDQNQGSQGQNPRPPNRAPQADNQTQIENFVKSHGFDNMAFKTMVIEKYGTPTSFNNLNADQCREFCNFVLEKKKVRDAEPPAGGASA